MRATGDSPFIAPGPANLAMASSKVNLRASNLASEFGVGIGAMYVLVFAHMLFTIILAAGQELHHSANEILASLTNKTAIDSSRPRALHQHVIVRRFCFVARESSSSPKMG
jgi:hypothetical protein